MIAFALLMTLQLNAQDKLYLVFEFMKVDNKQEAAYADTEEFWAKIHEQRVINGDIIGWDLWSLQPGGEDQHFQYMTVNLYDDPVKMMSGAGDFDAAVKWQKTAIALLLDDYPIALRVNYEARCGVYQSHQPYHKGSLWSFSDGELVAHWKFDEVYRGEVLDSAGKGHHL